jgi:hypothetical protein
MDKSEESNKITKEMKSLIVSGQARDNNSGLEGEWLDLVREAMEFGITKKQFQDFLKSEAQKRGIVIRI